MTSACPHCYDTGAIGAGYCDCSAATTLRARIDAHPGMQKLRARIDRMLGDPSPSVIVNVSPGVSVVHDTAPVIGVDYGFEPSVAVVGYWCGRCKTMISTSDDWATVRAAVHAHRVTCPAPGADNLEVN